MVKLLIQTAIVYCRTSTAGQKHEKTIGAQIAWAKEAVKRDGVKLLPYGPKKDGWVVDDGVSGSLLEGREFSKLIDDIQHGTVKPNLLYCYSLARLAREDKSSKDKDKQIRSRMDAARIAAVLGTEGVLVRDETGTNDPNTIAFDVKHAVATEEYRGIRSRTMAGKARVLANNSIATGGRPPYGYVRVPIDGDRRKGTTYDVHPVEGKRFSRVMEWYVQGGASHASRKAMEEKWPSPRGSKVWRASTIQQMLNNIAAYLGSTTRTLDKRPFEVTYPPLVSAKTYAAITLRMRERTLKARTTLLSTGFADCVCGEHVHGHRTASNQLFRLVCGRRGPDGLKREPCGSVVETPFSRALWEAVVCRLIQIREHERITTGGKDPYGPQLEAAKGKLGIVNEKLEKVVALFLDGAIDKQALSKTNEKLRTEKIQIQSEIDRLTRQRQEHAQKGHAQQSVQMRVQALLLKLRGNIPIEGKRQVLKDLLAGERALVKFQKKGGCSITLPAFGQLPPVTITIGDDIAVKMLGSSLEVQRLLYSAPESDVVEDVSVS